MTAEEHIRDEEGCRLAIRNCHLPYYWSGLYITAPNSNLVGRGTDLLPAAEPFRQPTRSAGFSEGVRPITTWTAITTSDVRAMPSTRP